MTQIAIGQWLDSWIVEEPLGEGAFAKVFRGKHSAHQHAAALKVPTDSRYVDRLRIDPRALQLEHAHIVRAQELHLEHDPPFVVLDLVEGGNLREAMYLEHVSWDRTSRIVNQLAGALDHAHDRGVLHLDLKPENVLLDARGDVRLTDFGVVPPGAQEVLAQSLLLSAELGVVGTRDYAAPEMRAHNGTLDRRADVYGLGVVAFELLTGRLPIGLDRPSQLRPDLPPAVDDVLGSALARDPARRPTSAGAFAASLRQALKVEEHDQAPSPPNRNMAWLAGAAGALVLGVLAAIALQTAPEPTQGWALHDLWADVPAESPVVLLPVEAVGAGTKPAARAVRAVLDRGLLSDQHSVYHPETFDNAFTLDALWDGPSRAELVQKAGTRWAIQASTLHGNLEVQDAFCALVDLEALTLVAARPARDAEALSLAKRLAVELNALPPGAVSVNASIDADLQVNNFSSARFDDELLCGLVTHLEPDHPVLVDFGRHSATTAGTPLPVAYQVDVELDAQRGKVRAGTVSLLQKRSVDEQEVEWTVPAAYDPTAGATLLTKDPTRLANLEQAIDAALDEALARANGALQAGNAEDAVNTLSAYRARGEGYASRVPPLVALAEARRTAKDLDGCLLDYRKALTLDPSRTDLRQRYASVCLEEARALYDAGKGSWYQNDDEDKFSRAQELLQLTDNLELDPELRSKLDALAADVRKEL